MSCEVCAHRRAIFGGSEFGLALSTCAQCLAVIGEVETMILEETHEEKEKD